MTRKSHLPPAPKIILEHICYNREEYLRTDDASIEHVISNLKPDHVNWINLDGLHDASIIEKIQSHFCLHSLLIEDVLNDQRPKSEEYEDYLYVTLKMLHRIEGHKIDYEQISFVLGQTYLISFQEKEGDLFDAFRERIRLDQGRARKKKADYLLYRLLDVIIENYYIILDSIGEQIENLEGTLNSRDTDHTFQKIQSLKKELIYLRKAVFPLREALGKIIKEEPVFIEEENIRYYADLYDHIIHLTDSLDTYKDLTAGLLDYHINIQNQRMNEVMKLLTVITTIFIPLTFIAGIYGMNFDHMPELRWPWGYPLVLLAMAAIMIGMIVYFKFKRWF